MKHIAIYLFLVAIVSAQTTNKNITSFNGGELSPLMKSRNDYPKYDSGAQTLKNFIPTPQGPITRRPGTKYIATVKDSNDPARLFPYNDNYIVEAGDDYFRFFTNGGQIYDGDDPYEITTSYDANDLFDLQYVQTECMRIVGPNYPPSKLTRFSDTSWAITEIDFKGGPFLDENENKGITITCSTTGSGEDYDYYITGEDAAIDATGGTWISQTFTATEDYNAVGVNLKLYRKGYPGTVTISLRAADSNEPTGADLVSGTTSGNSLTDGYGGEWRYISFSEVQEVTTSSQYAIVVRAPTGDLSNKVYWRCDKTSPTYTAGEVAGSTDSGSSWVTYDLLDIDCMFEVAAQDGNSAAITLEATADIFDANHVGSLWQITHTMASENVNGRFYGGAAGQESFQGSLAVQKGRRYSLTTHGIWSGTISLQRSYDNSVTWEDVEPTPLTYQNDGNAQIAGEEEMDDAIYRLHFVYPSSPYGSCDYNLTAGNYVSKGIVKISSVTDANTAVGIADTDYPILDTTATYKWSEGAWSDYRGWPRTIETHDQRIIYGGSRSYPQTVWSSVIAKKDEDYDKFEIGTEDDKAWIYVLAADGPIQWLKSLTYLMIGTEKGIGRLGAEGKITPTLVDYKQQSVNGCAYIMPEVADNHILYLERNGRKVRRVNYDFSSEGFVTPDLTTAAEHILGEGAVQMAFQHRPYPMLYCIRDDGEMAVLVYEPDSSVVAWTRYVTGE